MSSEATKRAAMPGGTNVLLGERTVEHSNSNLLTVLQPGQRVLDAGCGSGAITRGISNYTSPGGEVTGIDPSAELIGIAREKYGDVTGLVFLQATIEDHRPDELYDVVSTARTLQWLAFPQQAINRLSAFLKPGGVLCILDYNHTKISWHPAPPASMQLFYNKFLQWRSDAGMDNAIADNAAEMLRQQHFTAITETDVSETATREDEGFAAHASIWTIVAQLRGPQLVADGYITEAERLQAIDDYNRWIAEEGTYMQLYMKAIHGRKPA